MKRTACSACQSPDLDVFLDLGLSPIADAYTDSPSPDAGRHPLQVAVCERCHLAQLTELVPADILFSDRYAFYSSGSPPLVAYHQRYATQILARYPDEAALGVLEIGCNDGDLLRHFRHLPHLGVDPAGGPVSVARSRGLDVIAEPFTAKLAAATGRKFGLILANHILAHVEDVADTLAGISTLLADTGVVIVEVQYLPDLLVNNAFDLIYHEHRHFFSLTTLERAARLHGLYVCDAELTDRQGGSLRATLRRRATPGTNTRLVLSGEQWLASLDAYTTMQGRAERIRTRLQDLIQQQATGRTVVAYGAPAKATTLLNFCDLRDGPIECVLDPAPSKIGRYVPGTALHIVSPHHRGIMEDPHDVTVVLLIWNYASAIMRQYDAFMGGGGRWILPLPAPMVL